MANISVKAVFLDALGTLIELEPPWDALGRALPGAPRHLLVPAMRAEMAYYRDHSHEGRDAASLAELRARAAQVLSEALGIEVSVETLLDAIRFRAYPDAAPSLAALRRRGLRLVCVSNWDISLPDVLAGCGLSDALDGVVCSAAVGARKPDPKIFEFALELARIGPDEALHVGDTPDEDVAGARAAGIRPLLVDRTGSGDIASLEEIAAYV